MNQDRPVKPSADEQLLDGLLTLAVREEMEEEDAEPMPDIEVPESLDRRMGRKIVLHRIRDGLARHVRGIAAVFIAALAITVAVLAAQRADADMPLPPAAAPRFWLGLLRNMIFKAVIRVGAGYFKKTDGFFLIGAGQGGGDLAAVTRAKLELALAGLEKGLDLDALA